MTTTSAAAAVSDELKPCPFCGAGSFEIKENGKMWSGMKWSEPSSVSVWHWCAPSVGQPSRGIERVGRDRASAIAAWNHRAVLALAASLEGTPGAQWAVKGESDPHGTRYDCERAALCMGDLTDDELANAVFMHGNERPSIADLADGKALPAIAYLTAAKDRIRWLSRKLAESAAPLEQPGAGNADLTSASGGETVQTALSEAALSGRKTRDVAGILHFLTPQQMAEEIVRLDAVLVGRTPAVAPSQLSIEARMGETAPEYQLRMDVGVQSFTICRPRETMAEATWLMKQFGKVLDRAALVEHRCETCEGKGTVDETLGGEHFANPVAPCPDCDGNGATTIASPSTPSAGGVQRSTAELADDICEAVANLSPSSYIAELITAHMLAASPSAPAAEPSQPDWNFCWLVELRPAFEGHPPFPATYYAGYMVDTFDAAKTTEPDAAAKFSRKEDAERVAKELGHTISCVWEAIQHGFATGTPTGAASLPTLTEFTDPTLADIAEGLEKGYELAFDVGDGCPEVESTTAYAARFIRAYLAAKKETPHD